MKQNLKGAYKKLSPDQMANQQRKAILKAYADLPADQKATIDQVLMRLINSIKHLAPNQPFGPAMGLEVLGALSILMVEEEA